MINQNYPQNLSTMTDDQIQSSLDFFLTLPLEELRERQEIANQQLMRVSQDSDPSESPLMGISNLQVMLAMLFVAVDITSFPDLSGELDADGRLDFAKEVIKFHLN